MNRSVIWLTFLCVVLTLLCATAARADYGAGRTAWEAGRYAEALKEWRQAARVGDRRAMVALGRAFVKGLGVPQDFVEAHKWFNLAAARGDARAAAERDALEKRMTIEEQRRSAQTGPGMAVCLQAEDLRSLLPRRKAQRPASPPRRMVRKRLRRKSSAGERGSTRGFCRKRLRPREGAGGGGRPERARQARLDAAHVRSEQGLHAAGSPAPRRRAGNRTSRRRTARRRCSSPPCTGVLRSSRR